MRREPIDPDVAAALSAFLAGEGMEPGSADAVVAALSRDLADGQPAAARIYDGLLRRAIESSRDAVVALGHEMADISAVTAPIGEA